MPIEIPFMSAISSMFTEFIYEHMTSYKNLTSNITKGQKRVKKGPKQVQNGKNFKKLIELSLNHNFLYNTHKPYRIHNFNHTHVIRGY